MISVLTFLRQRVQERLRTVQEGARTHLHRLEEASVVLAIAVAAASLATSSIWSPYSAAYGVAVTVGIVVLVWLVVAGRRRTHDLAAGLAALVAIFVPDAISLWPAAAAAVFVSVLVDPSPRPWRGWAAGGAGAVVSLVLYSYMATVAPFLATLVGGALAVLLRAVLRSGELTRETQVLRERTEEIQTQSRWLEQRTVLARELHDVVGHHVTAMVVQAEAGLVGDPTRSLRAIGELGRTALGELDALVVHLRDPDAPLVLSAPPRLSDIDELLAAPLRQQGVQVEVRVDPDLALDEVLTLITYRIAQETLTNIARHAEASYAWVELGPLAGRVRLRVTDDGIGPPATISRGSGLLGIEERVRAAGGLWVMSDRPGGGTVVDVFLPLPATEPAGVA